VGDDFGDSWVMVAHMMVRGWLNDGWLVSDGCLLVRW